MDCGSFQQVMRVTSFAGGKPTILVPVCITVSDDVNQCCPSFNVSKTLVYGYISLGLVCTAGEEGRISVSYEHVGGGKL
jgi:hypothetical protein